MEKWGKSPKALLYPARVEVAYRRSKDRWATGCISAR